MWSAGNDGQDLGKRPFPDVRSANRQQGFTLIELMMVLFILVLGSAIIGINVSSGNNSTELKAAAKDIVSALRYAKGQAAIERQQITVDFDLGSNTYRVSGRDKVYAFPESIEITIVTADNEIFGQGLAGFRFYPDGSSTGGRITLERGGNKWQIDINWLTGLVGLHEPEQ